jgi:hypothetical protein
MIVNEDGDKCSPKDLANEILVKCLERVEFWLEANPQAVEDMTDRELGLLNDQLAKQANRCFKLLGFNKEVCDEV